MMETKKKTITVKNQINIGKTIKRSVIANGDRAVATGNKTKTISKKSLWNELIGSIIAFFKGK